MSKSLALIATLAVSLLSACSNGNDESSPSTSDDSSSESSSSSSDESSSASTSSASDTSSTSSESPPSTSSESSLYDPDDPGEGPGPCYFYSMFVNNHWELDENGEWVNVYDDYEDAELVKKRLTRNYRYVTEEEYLEYDFVYTSEKIGDASHGQGENVLLAVKDRTYNKFIPLEEFSFPYNVLMSGLMFYFGTI